MNAQLPTEMLFKFIVLSEVPRLQVSADSASKTPIEIRNILSSSTSLRKIDE
jgi:hypothetical protein